MLVLNGILAPWEPKGMKAKDVSLLKKIFRDSSFCRVEENIVRIVCPTGDTLAIISLNDNRLVVTDFSTLLDDYERCRCRKVMRWLKKKLSKLENLEVKVVKFYGMLYTAEVPLEALFD